jgi:hypothetical protein
MVRWRELILTVVLATNGGCHDACAHMKSTKAVTNLMHSNKPSVITIKVAETSCIGHADAWNVREPDHSGWREAIGEQVIEPKILSCSPRQEVVQMIPIVGWTLDSCACVIVRVPSQ